MMLASAALHEDFAPKPLPYFQRAQTIYRRSLLGLGIKRLEVAEPKNPARREECRHSFLAFCLKYFPAIFWNPNKFHQAFAAELERLILSSSPILMRKALAAPRGSGKTTVCTLALLWAMLYGHVKFCLVLTANATKATERLDSIRDQVLNNDLLFEDFPEICGPVREFNGDPRMAPPGFPWNSELLRMANGAYLAGQGMDGAIAGALKNFMRPDFILVDDMETVDSVVSEAKTDHLRARLFQEVLKLVPQDRHSVCFYICTIKRSGCISDELTNAQKNPEWRGERIKALPALPRRADLWDCYMEWIKPEGRNIDGRGKVPSGEELTNEQAAQKLEIPWGKYKDLTSNHQQALRFYSANRETMDDGAELLDPERLPLWKCMYERAADGERVFWCEIQNEPPADDNELKLDLEVSFLEKRCVGEAEGMAPAWAAWTFATIDMGLHACHWELSAWADDHATSQLIAQGIQETNVNAGGRYRMEDNPERKKLMMADGIRQALEALNGSLAQGVKRADGTMLFPALIGVDARGGDGQQAAWQDIVFAHCLAAGPKWIALRGDPFTEGDYRKAQGRNWFFDPQTRCVNFNADHFKTKNWNALNMPALGQDGRPARGARIFHRQTPREYMRHHTAETYCENFEGDKPAAKALRVGWLVKQARIPNHWWDTASMQQVLAELAPFALQQSHNQTAPQAAAGVSQPPSWVRRERF